MFFITWALIFSFISLVVCKTARGRDYFINCALIAYLCALATVHLDKMLVMTLYIAGISFTTYIFYKERKK